LTTNSTCWTELAKTRYREALSVVLMNLWIYPLLVVWTVLGVVISFPAIGLWKLVKGWPVARIMHLGVWLYGRGCLLICRPFVRLELKDVCLERLPPGILVLNHYSFFDTYLTSVLPAYDAHICLRSWPFRMPWYALFMRMAGYIDLESLPWDQILAKARDVAEKGRYLVVFPEGHRSRTGSAGRFHSGAFKLATQLQVPILPLCVYGTHTLLPPGRWWFKPATVKLRLLEPVCPGDYCGDSPHIEMRKDVRRLMMEAVEQMRCEQSR